MKGVYYNRHASYDSNENKDDWHQPVEGESIILNRQAFSRFFPEVQIQGEIVWRCEDHSDERCEGCNGCGHNVKLTFDRDGFVVNHIGDNQTHMIDEFSWGWSGSGATEHWFDDGAICLKSTNEYRSGSGLTADSGRVVAYNRKVEVDSFRGDCKDETRTLPQAGKIWAEFVNHPASYRANWTGFSMGSLDGGGRYTSSGGWVSDATPIIGDALDNLIEVMLSGNLGQPTVCRHNRNVQAHIVASDPGKISLYLCKSCRMRGVRWEEFITRNRQDTCPYFRRACKSVVERSDSFPDWFAWGGDNLLSATSRMQDGEHLAYEVVYVRRKEGFVRRAVLLLNNRTREAWMHRYNGFVPRTMVEFQTKYAEGRQINGYMGTGPTDGYRENPNDRFLSEARIAAAVAQGLEIPLWKSDDGSTTLIRFSIDTEGLPKLQKGEVGGLDVVPLTSDGNEDKNASITEKPQPFYTDQNGNEYYLLQVGNPWVGGLAIRKGSQELKRVDSTTGYWYLMRVGAPVSTEVPLWERPEGEHLKKLVAFQRSQGRINSIAVVSHGGSSHHFENRKEFENGAIIESDHDHFYSANWIVRVEERLKQATAQMFRAYLPEELKSAVTTIE